ncbi:MAG: hypothetical protein NZ893_02575 [Candidatus Aenigmarchaeota archaeon]|nr:hypothetical protein [Candidatus Aenigmarchaeota archaeon]
MKYERFKVGILFDISELGDWYGKEAYKILFESVDTTKLVGSVLKDGDTRASAGKSKSLLYCY